VLLNFINKKEETLRVYEKLGFLFILFCISSCTTYRSDTQHAPLIQFPAPLREPASEPEEVQQLTVKSEEIGKKPKTRFQQTPGVSLPSAAVIDPIQRKQKPISVAGEPVTVNFDGLSLPAFINEVYGNILKISFEIDSSLRDKRDLITLRTDSPVPFSEIDSLSRQVLGNYGVAVESQGNILRFIPGKGGAPEEPPLLVSGRTLPEVPVSHRPIFQLVPLKVVRNVHVAGWLKQAYKGQKIEISEDPERNAVLLMGTPSIVNQALQAVRMLDQPYMRGRFSTRIEPVFMNADELSKLLVDVLNTEGYSATLKPPMGSIIILPLTPVNAILVFAADASVLEHVKEWAETLDRPGQDIGKSETRKREFFYYQVQNTRAAELSGVLDKVLSNVTVPQDPSQKDTAPQVQESHDRLVVDEIRNGIIFQGNITTWEDLLPVIKEMDRPPRMVLLEVTVAEITLSDQEELGIEWGFNDLNENNEDGMKIGTLDGLSIGAKGFSYILDNAGQTRAVLNAFASQSRVSILSTPRVMVKSGGDATIDVGTEVPIITSQSTSSDLQQDGTSAILQEIQYRKTGVLLSVKPVVHSGNRIDLEISQEVSEHQPDSTSNISSPNIFTRKIETSLSLKDGGSVMLGGLISSTMSKGYSGIPVLSKIPILGRLFRVEEETEVRTEMIMLIIPYVIDSNQDAEAVTEAFKKACPAFGISK